LGDGVDQAAEIASRTISIPSLQTVRKVPGLDLKWREGRAVREFGPFGPRWLPDAT
jgi:hypothetical protein